jgi:hypothetical protein
VSRHFDDLNAVLESSPEIWDNAAAAYSAFDAHCDNFRRPTGLGEWLSRRFAENRGCQRPTPPAGEPGLGGKRYGINGGNWRGVMWPYPKTSFQPEVTRAIEIAVQNAYVLLSLPKTGDEAESVTRKVLELAQSGERDAMRLCVDAVKCFQA